MEQELLLVDGLTKRYGSFTLDQVSFSVPGGSIVGFIGENGAGKTTTLRLILDEIPRDGGRVSVFGRDNREQGSEVREEIGVVFDECHFHEMFTPGEIGKILSKCYRCWDGELYRSLLSRFALPEKGKKIKEFSRGMKMKLGIAAALAHHPRLLLLDEATSGLDPIVRDEMLELLQEFVGDEEHAILFSSHITEDLEKVADYIVFLHKGRVMFSEQKDTLLYDWGVIKCGQADLSRIDREDIAAVKSGAFETRVLTKNREAAARKYRDLTVDHTSIEEIMVLYGRGEEQ